MVVLVWLLVVVAGGFAWTFLFGFSLTQNKPNDDNYVSDRSGFQSHLNLNYLLSYLGFVFNFLFSIWHLTLNHVIWFTILLLELFMFIWNLIFFHHSGSSIKQLLAYICKHRNYLSRLANIFWLHNCRCSLCMKICYQKMKHIHIHR